jgi:broad specificity phosphatase PhoE
MQRLNAVVRDRDVSPLNSFCCEGADIMPLELPQRFLYVRHGRTFANDGLIKRSETPTAVVELTDLGRQQANETAAFLAQHLLSCGRKRVLLCVSPYRRTRQTAEIISKKLLGAGIRLDTVFDPRLVEQNSGHYDRDEPYTPTEWQTAREAANRHEAYFYHKPPGGESQQEALLRQIAFLGELQTAETRLLTRLLSLVIPNRPVIVVGHGITGRLMRGWIRQEADLPAWFAQEPNIPNAGVWGVVGRKLQDGYLFIPSTETL